MGDRIPFFLLDYFWMNVIPLTASTTHISHIWLNEMTEIYAFHFDLSNSNNRVILMKMNPNFVPGLSITKNFTRLKMSANDFSGRWNSDAWILQTPNFYFNEQKQRTSFLFICVKMKNCSCSLSKEVTGKTTKLLDWKNKKFVNFLWQDWKRMEICHLKWKEGTEF